MAVSHDGLQPALSPPCMPTFKPSIILSSLILSTLQEPQQSLLPSPGILAHGHLTRTHQILHCVFWPCAHISNQRIPGLDEALQSISFKHLRGAQIPSTVPLTGGLWGPTIGMRTGMGYTLHKWQSSTLCSVTRPPIPFWITIFKCGKRSLSNWTEDPSLALSPSSSFAFICLTHRPALQVFVHRTKASLWFSRLSPNYSFFIWECSSYHGFWSWFSTCFSILKCSNVKSILQVWVSPFNF